MSLRDRKIKLEDVDLDRIVNELKPGLFYHEDWLLDFGIRTDQMKPIMKILKTLNFVEMVDDSHFQALDQA